MRESRLGALAAIVLGAALGLPGVAGAQGCGASYTVRSGDTLGAIATRCATSVEALVKANPQIRNPARLTVGWELAVPGAPAPRAAEAATAGSRAAEALVEKWAEKRDASAAPVLATGRYTVEPGDTMARIATRLGLPLAGLIGANEGVNPFRLKPGQVLALPSGEADDAPAEGAIDDAVTVDGTQDDAATGAAATDDAAPDDAAPDDAATADAAPDDAATADTEGAGAVASYTVQPGDSFARIARRVGVPLAALRAANAGVNPVRLRPGQALALPTGAPSVAPSEAPSEPAPEPPDAGAGGTAASAGEAEERAELPPGAPPRRPDVLARRQAAGSGTEPAASPAAELPADNPAEPDETAAAEPAAPPAVRAVVPAPEPERLSLEGRIRRGVECPVLVTSDGHTYSLVSQNYGFTIGDYVAIEGEPVEMTFCTQGRTIRVTSMTDKPAPQGG